MTKSVQGEGEIRGRSHLLWGTEKEKEKKNKREGEKNQRKALEVDGILSQQQMFFWPLSARSVRIFHSRSTEMVAPKVARNDEYANGFSSDSPHGRQ